MEFTYKLKELRLGAHMTQAELAKALFVSRTLVSKWESGDRHPTEENIQRLCELFSVSRERLLGIPSETRSVRRDARGSLLVGYSLGLALSLVSLFVLLLFQRSDPWAPIGAFMLSLGYAFPVGVAFLLLVLDFRRKREGRRASLLSFFALLAVWLFSIVAYHYIF